MEREQASFEGWAVIDVMGHQRYVGYVTTEAYGQAVLFRIDVPELEERERVTKRPGYAGDDGRYLPAGTTVKEGAVPGYTKLIGSGSIYAITPCTKEAALAAVEEIQKRPLMSVQLPPERAIAPVFDMGHEGAVEHDLSDQADDRDRDRKDDDVEDDEEDEDEDEDDYDEDDLDRDDGTGP